MKLLVGLGNPGAQYAQNRHNIGFMALDAIHDRHGQGPFSRKFKGEIAEATIDGEKALLLKPLTFMNLSGDSVGEAMRFYKLGPEDITVFHDELDLPPGRVRVKIGGGHGGHNGLKSIDAHCGRDYRRVRLGIGHPGDKARVHGHVLGDFSKADRDWLEPLLDGVSRDIALAFAKDASAFLNRLPGQQAEPKPERPKPDAAPAANAQPKAQSHVHSARDHKPKIEPTGPMAEMLKKLLGKG